ncbi:TetR/AcrR family transcriptional regulator [Cryptosporangium phraense]|uniref:TetR/AcrR family transcriptional regulator n=1 Tax=Cryptosporangium phraense TaxID=2593070 RepID=A0A545AW32_9ACTN|nr:TetR/AcrR family transcriptional regulator [Cryptosporangium phraense]TQS45524.1 TetR/AcrR family transcriptional regulator [Cryptosporangium phraense]
MEFRPGGRTARVRAAVLRAAEDALIENGFAGLDLADVARRAVVGKTTVYRRWGTVPALVAELLTEMAASSSPRTESGWLDEDLRANARLVQRTLTDARQGPLFRSILAAALTDAGTAAALRDFYEVRVAEWAPVVEAAVARGELPAGTDPEKVIRAVSAPLYYRLLTAAGPEEADADAAASVAAAAARAGAFRSPGPPVRGADRSAG